MSHRVTQSQGLARLRGGRAFTYSFIHHARTYQSRSRRPVEGPKEEGKG